MSRTLEQRKCVPFQPCNVKFEGSENQYGIVMNLERMNCSRSPCSSIHSCSYVFERIQIIEHTRKTFRPLVDSPHWVTLENFLKMTARYTRRNMKMQRPVIWN
jgi:hypothetical protein